VFKHYTLLHFISGSAKIFQGAYAYQNCNTVCLDLCKLLPYPTHSLHVWWTRCTCTTVVREIIELKKYIQLWWKTWCVFHVQKIILSFSLFGIYLIIET